MTVSVRTPVMLRCVILVIVAAASNCALHSLQLYDCMIGMGTVTAVVYPSVLTSTECVPDMCDSRTFVSRFLKCVGVLGHLVLTGVLYR
jgi:hypothetical protein